MCEGLWVGISPLKVALIPSKLKNRNKIKTSMLD